ncbi:MAG TPA: YdcF family protein [Bryobacteraceae bacterium]|jgi:uncharacterized SAM-binding protein YcdF (DUF218 family)|nr:YdcF family protein [Bryobacteraceae bacterium]
MTAMTYVQPLVLIFLTTILVGLVQLRRGNGSRLMMIGFLGLALASWPPVDWLLSRPFEAWYPVQSLPSSHADAIVVLSSAVSPPTHERPYALPDKETFQRCEFAAWLHKHWQPIPVLACGGPGAKGGQAFSATMRQMLERAGVPDAMIWTEERSRSTHENAIFGSELLRKHGVGRIALVVEARSMPRAAACFRKEGIVVIPAPCAFREFESAQEELIPSWKAVKENENTLHESLGLVWYWLRRWV